jgi:DNA-binding transcriptional LysR family regulator
MDLKTIKTFKTIINENGFVNASYKLGCTQSTVTFHIQQLEQELGMKLFEKIGRKMVLTQDAKDIMPLIDDILLSLEQIKNYKKDSNEITGKLRIAMPETLLIYKMQEVLKEFKLKAPNVELSIQGMNCYEVRQQLLKGNIDLGIHYDVGKYIDTFISNRLNNFKLTLVASPNLSKKYFNFVMNNQVKPLSIVSNHPRALYKEYFLKYLNSKQIILQNTLEVGSIEATKQSILSNLGIAYVPEFTVENEIKNGDLIELEHEIEDTSVNAIYVYHKNKYITKAMSLFIKLLQKKLK